MLDVEQEKRIIKVLLINTVATDRNGITGVLFNYLRNMKSDAFQLDLLSLNNPNQSYICEVKNRGGEVYVLPRLDGIIRYMKELISLIKRNKYQVVHIHGNSHTVILELVSAWIAGCKIRIVHSHNTTCSIPLIHRILTPIFNLFYTHGIACGKEAGYWMFGRKPFTVFNNGVNTDIFAFNKRTRDLYRQELGVQEENILVGHVGLFNEQKNHSFLIKVFRELYNKDRRYRLLLIGDGELRPMIAELVNELGLKNAVCFTGSIPNVADYLNAIDLILMPSLYEGLPLALVEQQANGLKCIVSDAISKEADKTGNMLFLSLNNPAEKWAKTVLNLNTVSRDDASKQSIEKIKRVGYCIQNEARRLEDYYMGAYKKTYKK